MRKRCGWDLKQVRCSRPRVSLDEHRSLQQRMQYFDALEARLANDPNVLSVGLVSTLPGTHAAWSRVGVDGVNYSSSNEMPAALSAVASPSFFRTLGIRAEVGRLFNSQDVSSSDPVMVINARFAERFLKGVDPMGKRIRFGAEPDAPARTIIGVVPNLWMGAFDASPERNPAVYYVPLAQSPPASVAMVVNMRSAAPLSFTESVRSAAYTVDPDVPLHEVRDIPTLIREGTWFYGMGAGILAVCGTTALLLAITGVYGVIAFSVRQRRKEFGVRMALGATATSIVQLVFRRGVIQVALGLSMGMVLALLLARGVQSLMFDASSTDIGVYVMVAVSLGTIAAVSMLVPAVSASRVEPLEALRDTT